MPAGKYPRTEEHKRNLAQALRGKKRTPEQCTRISAGKRGLPSPKKGKNYPQCGRSGEQHWAWKGGKGACVDCGKTINRDHVRCQECHLKRVWGGEKVHMDTLHQWIRKNKPKPDLCERCGEKPPYDCANISGEYLRDVNDYEWLCRRCHMLKDGRLQRTIERNQAGKKE